MITPLPSILGTLIRILPQDRCAEPFYSGKVAVPVEGTGPHNLE